ncbi:MAG: FAD-binding protein [Rhodobacteraceae bacterium]|nr:FAD-binding protein [Paracoccaceae bacterium]
MMPTNEAELAEMIRAATGPLSVRGGNTRGLAGPGAPLGVGAISGIGLYEPGALTLVARAGTPLADIEAALAAENQGLPFEPMDHRGLLGTEGTPTIGGVIAANVSGPRRIAVGAARDFLLGVRYVDGAGTVIKNGGRVMKNVTGYDLVKLMAGSHGTLGVMTEVALKVLPRAETAATVVLGGLGAGAGVAAMSAALGTPYEVSAAAYDPATGEAMLRIEGFAASVAYRAERLADVLSDHGKAELRDGAQSQALWRDIRDVAAFRGTDGDVWRISVKPGDAPAFLDAVAPDAALLDWGGGLIWARMPEGADLRRRAGAFAGHATLVRGTGATRATLGAFHPQPSPLAAIAAGLRQRFDPRGILNPGLMG